MLEKVGQGIYKIKADSNVYFLDFSDRIVIDTGRRANRHLLVQFLGKLTDLKKVKAVIFTHLHYDHTGNTDLFPNATFFASAAEIEDLEKCPEGAVLSHEDAARLKGIDFRPAKSMYGLKVIRTPGHTRGSICLWYEKEGILFSGDTLFFGGHGRTDLPTSEPDQLHDSIGKLRELNPKVLCPGHEY